MDKAPIHMTDETLTQFWTKAERYITRGKPVELRMDMTVCEMHQLWDDLWARGNCIAGALNRYADKLRQRAQTLPRNDKIRLNKRAEFYAARAKAVSGIAECRFGEAQEDLASVLVLDDDQRETFFNDIGHRPGIEHTWQMTLQQVADHVAATVEAEAPAVAEVSEERSGAAGALAPGGSPVDASRLDCGLWLPQGDIYAAYSAGAENGKGIRRVKTFKHDGKLWTNMGGCHGPYRVEANCHPLIPEAEYNGPTGKVPYSHEGELCQYRGVQYRLGSQHTFISKDRSLEQWQRLLRTQYEKGGHFTSNKTYHEILNDFAEKKYWDRNRKEYVHGSTIAPNYFKAIELELARPDFSKWITAGETLAPAGTAVEQLALAFV